MFHGIQHRLLGDGVEYDALDRLLFERVFLLEDFEDVPGDRFALAIGVGRENELVRPFQRLGDIIEAFAGLVVDLPNHPEIVIRIDRAVLGRKVPYVAEGRQYFVAGAKIFIDRLGLGRRFNNDDIHEFPKGYRAKRRL